MNIARIALLIMVVLFVLVLVVAVILPSQAHVQRDMWMKAPVEKVFPHINSLKAMKKWSPWAKIDPDTQYVFDGPEQGVGSRMTWNSGDAAVGGGEQTIIKSEHNARVEMALVFGDQGDAISILSLTPEADGTRVTWELVVDFGWDLSGRYVGLFMDGMIGRSYVEGLADLKKQVE